MMSKEQIKTIKLNENKVERRSLEGKWRRGKLEEQELEKNKERR